MKSKISKRQKAKKTISGYESARKLFMMFMHMQIHPRAKKPLAFKIRKSAWWNSPHQGTQERLRIIKQLQNGIICNYTG